MHYNFVISTLRNKSMLYTNLKHIDNAAHHAKVISENENVMVCCGRMGPMCTPVYAVMEAIENEYPNVKFFDMEFDNPESHVIRNLSEVRGFKGIPFVIYYKNGKVVRATSSIQARDQITAILESVFALKTDKELIEN
jgi:thioredoxin 1